MVLADDGLEHPGEAREDRARRSGYRGRIDVLLLAPRCWPRRIVNAWQPGA
jgi:putative endonuclease